MNRFARLNYERLWKILTFFRYKNVLKILDQEWDYLIILDACRYDTFEKANDIDGKLSKVISAGSSTREWIKNNFSGTPKLNIDYLSANPYVSDFKLKQLIGHNPFNITDIWNWGWDKELGTVHPKTVVDTAKDKIEKSNNRMIIHFLQPHHPFINGGLPKSLKLDYNFTVWHAFEKGLITKEEMLDAYFANLKLVLIYVKQLLKHLEGKVVITSDHGNCFGEYGLIGHPWKVKIAALREVPWLEVE